MCVLLPSLFIALQKWSWATDATWSVFISYTFLDLETFQLHCCLCEGQRALRFNQKYLNLCSEDEQRSYGFGTTWGWVINDRIFILGWTNPTNSACVKGVLLCMKWFWGLRTWHCSKIWQEHVIVIWGCVEYLWQEWRKAVTERLCYLLKGYLTSFTYAFLHVSKIIFHRL